MLYCAFTLGAD